MRTPTLFALALALAASACTQTVRRPTLPTEYACNGFSFTHDGTHVATSDDRRGPLEVSDSAGDHFVTRTTSSQRALELVVPSDPRRDAQARTYDTTFGTSTTSWRMTEVQTCTARGGYNDALARYIKGESIDQLTASLALDDRSDTRNLLRHAMTELTRRYYHEH